MPALAVDAPAPYICAHRKSIPGRRVIFDSGKPDPCYGEAPRTANEICAPSSSISMLADEVRPVPASLTLAFATWRVLPLRPQNPDSTRFVG